MSWQQAFPLFLKSPDSRPIREIEREILDELQFHIEMRTLDNVKAGMPPADARQDAVRRFGDFERIHKACRQTLLGERIVLQRVQAVLMVVLLGAVTFLGVQFYRSQQENQAAMANMMKVLNKLADERPVVVQTVPKTGDMEVDPSLSEIRVTYNRDMIDGSWAWCHEMKTTGKPHFETDKRTCVLPVQLEPGKEYAISLNTDQFLAFRDTTGRAAIPYLLRFRTRQ